MDKKTIKIKFLGFWEGFDQENNYFYNIIKKHFNVEISDNPEYVFCSVLGNPYEECKYEGVRIHFNGENYTPDFNIHDYGISFNPLQFGDRHLEYPLYLINETLPLANSKHLNITEQILSEKVYFCNFIYGTSRDFREQALKKFSTYKQVSSPGSGRNNMPDHPKVTELSQKLEFQNKCKFTIAFDSIQMPGFVTEKILHAFASRTVPIYYGAPDIGKYFNKKSFIDVADYGYDLDKVLERIIEIDNDDEFYLRMLSEPVFLKKNYIVEKEKQMQDFLTNIFSQDYNNAFRRSRIASPQSHNDRLCEYNKWLNSKFNILFRRLIHYTHKHKKQ